MFKITEILYTKQSHSSSIANSYNRIFLSYNKQGHYTRLVPAIKHPMAFMLLLWPDHNYPQTTLFPPVNCRWNDWIGFREKREIKFCYWKDWITFWYKVQVKWKFYNQNFCVNSRVSKTPNNMSHYHKGHLL